MCLVESAGLPSMRFFFWESVLEEVSLGPFLYENVRKRLGYYRYVEMGVKKTHVCDEVKV